MVRIVDWKIRIRSVLAYFTQWMSERITYITPSTMVSYRSARKLSSYLVRAKLYPLERKRGSYKCGNLRCLVCNNIEETDTFTSTVTGESLKINHHHCCNDKYLIYLLTCKVCKKQYTRKAVDRFRLQWNDYKESDRKFLRSEDIKQKSLHEHILNDSHQSFEKDACICLIDKTDPSEPHKRKYYWMRTLKTIAPFGLNTKETYWVHTTTCFTSVLPVYIIA